MPTLFTPEFNNFRKINLTEAWSLYFTGSKDENVLGHDPAYGRYITIGLFAAIFATALEFIVFQG